VPPRRRSPARRPRVAGLQHPTEPPGQPAQDEGRPGAVDNPTPALETVAPPRRPATGVATLVGLVAALVIALSLAAWFRGKANQLLGSAVASNDALVYVGATAQVSGQVREAVQRVFSYDFARLDDNERAATDAITGPFARDFPQQFARVRELAPGQQAVVVATVPALAVKVLDGDRAIVVVFIDQQAKRGAEAQPLLAAGRLTVTAQRVNGSWKIADVEPF
jgi:Mce-associated membrane protein